MNNLRSKPNPFLAKALREKENPFLKKAKTKEAKRGNEKTTKPHGWWLDRAAQYWFCDRRCRGCMYQTEDKSNITVFKIDDPTRFPTLRLCPEHTKKYLKENSNAEILR